MRNVNSRRAGTVLVALLVFVVIVGLIGIMLGAGASKVADLTEQRLDHSLQIIEDMENP